MHLPCQDSEDPNFTATKHLIEREHTVVQDDSAAAADLPEPRAPDPQLRESELIEPNTLESDGRWDPDMHQQFRTDGDMAIEAADDPLSWLRL